MGDFDDLISANQDFAARFDLGDLPGAAGAGIGMVTCMDSRIDPLRIMGLETGDAKIFRNPGGRVTAGALEAMILAANLLKVDRILVIPHTSCAMTKFTESELQEKVGASAGVDATWHAFHPVADQVAALEADVHTLRAHPLIPDTVKVGGFLYHVETGLLEQKL